MGRTTALLLRLCVITTAIVMLILSVRAVRAQDFSGAPNMRPSQVASDTPVYGYNPGQGMPHESPQPAPASTAPAPQPAPAGYNPQSPQAPYGYRQGDGVSGATHYGTRQATDPQANDQDMSAAAAPRTNADYRLGPGDKVRVTVYGEADLSGDYQIDGTGIVRLPLIGSIRASGYTAPALEQWIGSALSPAYLKSPRVNVEIVTYRPFYIIGAVNRPGEYPYVDHISALNAVALAGGFMESARQSTVYVRHENSAVEQEVSTDQLSELRPGDTIHVKTTLFWDVLNVFSPLAAPLAITAAGFHL